MKWFHVVRASENYEVVIVAESESRDSYEDNDTYYEFNDNLKTNFVPISIRKVRKYFSGLSDGMGWGKLPEESFNSMDAVRTWRKQKARRKLIEFYHRVQDDNDLPEELRTKAAARASQLEEEEK